MTRKIADPPPNPKRATRPTRISEDAARMVEEMHYKGNTTFQVPRYQIIIRAIQELYARECT